MIIETILTSIFGGATGIFGTIASQVGGYFERKQKMQELKMEFDQELALQKLQMDSRSMEIENEQAIVNTNASTSVKLESYAHDKSYGETAAWASTALKFFRPLLTLVLIGLSAYTYSFVIMDITYAYEIVQSVIFLTSMAIAWWFGDRGIEKLRKK